MKKIAVLLSGCGVYDGSEIHEATLTLYFLAQAGAEAVPVAPRIPQVETIDHLTGEKAGERRNVLVESARISRGQIRDIREVTGSDIDGLIIPGGFGAAKNLSNFVQAGESCTINEEVKRLIRDMVRRRKPVGTMCIAPVLVAKALQGMSGVTPTLTIGNDPSTAKKLEKLGAIHVTARVDEAIIDEANRIVSTPAYMIGPDIQDVARGIENLVKGVIELIEKGEEEV